MCSYNRGVSKFLNYSLAEIKIIFNVSSGEDMLYFFPNLWKSKIVVFPIFTDSFFAENRPLILKSIRH